MFRPVSLLLALVLALTSVGLGAARGTVMQGGQVVLCTGAGVVSVAAPAGHGTRGHVHLCPDMALSVLQAPLPVADPVAGRTALPMPAARPAATRTTARHRALPVRARGPPVSSFAPIA